MNQSLLKKKSAAQRFRGMRQFFYLMLLFASSFYSNTIFSQTIPVRQWDKTFGGSDDDLLRSIQQTTDEGYILGGSSFSNSSADKSQNTNGGIDYWIIKIDANGSKEWDRTFGGTDDDVFRSIQQTTDGGYILGGYSYSGISGNKSENSRGFTDYWVMKIDANGQKQWDKTFGGSNYDYLYSVQQTTDGGYILAGSSASNISGDKSENSKGSNDYWIVKIDANGEKQWDKTFGGNNSDELNSIQQTTDGGYILGGSSASNITGDKSENSKGSNDYWIVKIDANGGKQWDKTFGGNDNDLLHSIRQTTDEGYILGGSSASNISGDKSENSKGKIDYWVLKIDGNGVKQWDKAYGGSEDDELYSLQQTADRGFILGGYSYSGISGDKSENNNGYTDYWVLKTDANGEKQWDKTLGGNNFDELFSLQQTTDDGYILGGFSASNAGGDKSEINKGNYDYWVIKLCSPKTFYRDSDGDGFGTANDTTLACSSTPPSGYVTNNTDCNDSDATINPVTEWVLDDDADGYYTGTSITQCTSPGAGYVVKTTQRPGDCNDQDHTIYPNAQEICGDGKDNNCNGQVDENCAATIATILPSSIVEGNKGKATMFFSVVLNRPATTLCKAEYKTYDISAKAGPDYQKAKGTITFKPGQVLQQITVYVHADKKAEGNEQFGVQILNPVNLVINGTGKAIGTIIDDDNGDNSDKDGKTETKEENGKAEINKTTGSLTILPNPASNVLHINLRGYVGNVTIQISDMQGKTLQQKKLQAGVKFAQWQMDITKLANGTYIITVSDDKGNRETKQVVVVH